MASVVQLVEYKSRETAQVLQALTDMARRGELVGVALCYRTKDHEEHSAFTGAYKVHPGKAVNAAMRLSWKLTQLQDEMAGAT